MKDHVENLGLPTRGLNPRLQRSRPSFLPLDHSAAHVSKGNLATFMQLDQLPKGHHTTPREVEMLPRAILLEMLTRCTYAPPI